MHLKAQQSEISFQTRETSDSSTPSKIIKRVNRSSPLKTSRSKSKGHSDFMGNFYIKKITSFIEPNVEAEEQGNPENRLSARAAERLTKSTITQHLEHKKNHQQRIPTPSKSYSKIRRKQSSENSNNSKHRDYGLDVGLNVERQMEIHQMQKKIASEKKVRQIYQNKCKQLQSQIVLQVKKCKQLEKEVRLLRQGDKTQKSEIQYLQESIENSNLEIKSTKSNLERLKHTIRENRHQEIESELKQFKRLYQVEQQLNQKTMAQNNSLKNQIVDLKMQIDQLRYSSDPSRIKSQVKSQEQTLRNEIKQLKKELQEGKSVKEKFLEAKLLEMQTEVASLTEENKKCWIEINFLNRKKHEEFQMLKKKKQHEVKSLKYKYSSLLDRYKEAKSSKSREQIRIKVVEERKNRFEVKDLVSHRSIGDKSEDGFSFSLSPQLK